MNLSPFLDFFENLAPETCYSFSESRRFKGLGRLCLNSERRLPGSSAEKGC